MNARDEDATPTDELPEAGRQALSVLRDAWSARGQTSRDIDESSCGSGTETCKATDAVGFEGLADEVEATTNTAEAVGNLRDAWKKKLEREGKLNTEGKSLKDLVLETSESDQ